MVIAGKPRGNASQLADYLLAMGENERITIIDVDGHNDADETRLKQLLYSMELNSELTRSQKSVYHAYINPNPEDNTDRAMTMEEWQQSVDILTKQLGYEDQRRVVVLHEKPGNRVHAHIVYERYNHERGVMATYEHNYKAHDRARAEMELKLSHKPTPQKNKNRSTHKQTLTEIWQRTNSANEFIREAEANGYKIAKGTDRPFKVIDETGVSFDLVRKLDGIKTSELKARFIDIDLVPEKQAIREMQVAKKERQQTKQEHKQEAVQPQQTEQLKPEPAESMAASSDQTPAAELSREQERQKFLRNLQEVRERNRSLTREITLYVLIALKVTFSFKGFAAKAPKTESKQNIAGLFANNAVEIITPAQPPLKTEPPKKAINFWEAVKTYKPE